MGIWVTIGGQLSGQHHWTTWWATIVGQHGGQQLVVNTKPSGQVSWWQTHNFPGICICICCLSLRQYCLPGGQQLWWYCLQEFEASSSQRGASAGSRLKEKYLTATENFLSMSTSNIFGDKDIQISKYYQTILSYKYFVQQRQPLSLRPSPPVSTLTLRLCICLLLDVSDATYLI